LGVRGETVSKLRPVDYGNGERGYSFWCPGCSERHGVPTTGSREWGFNGDVDRPTFTPSIKVEGVKDPWGPDFDPTPTVCHSIVTDGRIAFCGDSTHALKGQTVDLPEEP
jgi:hypothetical protein